VTTFGCDFGGDILPFGFTPFCRSRASTPKNSESELGPASDSEPLSESSKTQSTGQEKAQNNLQNDDLCAFTIVWPNGLRFRGKVHFNNK